MCLTFFLLYLTNTEFVFVYVLEQYGGVIGVFNCQGAGWDTKTHRFRGFPECYKAVCGPLHVSEVEWDQKEEAEDMGKAEEYVVYLNQAEELRVMALKYEQFQITIQPSTFELFSFVPVTKLNRNVKFAPIGLINMLNSGGAIQELEYKEDGTKLKVKGEGTFLAYSSESPNKCVVNGDVAAFKWLPDAKLTHNISWNEKAAGVSDLTFFY